ncbi:hypothetical protein WELLINGTON_41 [Erwinia phage Wellington]|jgi:hypothetical protein|uniref:Uncharacterized protein n=2 Tax=Wellingtonvirus wellington TaxID=2734153 RepID=A0A1B2IDQ3_9CAUD|nr:hypothetical protein BIZ80_gp258 [Erwinia phage vB_EamM_Kwan]YP_009806525.1 hypothetical protein HOT70_gp260 [Erwinia phage Wellington]ANZ49393.1 hypothetical protein KWAN_41 [Erwinia phage vB_EamM_Kwan]AXF51172.1 hypothetical protein WELLINGTON_41 [Erwinia phage Wellington]
MNAQIFNERTLFPLSEPDNQGKQRKFNIEPNVFNGDCEGLKFSYSWGKGEGVYFDAPYGTCRQIIEAFHDALKKPEKSTLSFENGRGNKAPSVVHVGRGEDLVPFMALSGEVNGQKRTKKFFFYPAKGFRILRDGQPLSDLEIRERCARSFITDFELFLQHLIEVYKPRDFNNAGGFGKGGGGGYQRGGQSQGNGNQGGGYQNNQGGGQQGGYQNNNNNNRQAPPDQSFDDIML